MVADLYWTDGHVLTEAEINGLHWFGAASLASAVLLFQGAAGPYMAIGGLCSSAIIAFYTLTFDFVNPAALAWVLLNLWVAYSNSRISNAGKTGYFSGADTGLQFFWVAVGFVNALLFIYAPMTVSELYFQDATVGQTPHLFNIIGFHASLQIFQGFTILSAPSPPTIGVAVGVYALGAAFAAYSGMSLLATPALLYPVIAALSAFKLVKG